VALWPHKRGQTGEEVQQVLACRLPPGLALTMQPFDNGANPPRREPLPQCLTRLLNPQCLDAGYITPAASSGIGGPKKRTYARVLATIWLDLDRLDELTRLMVEAKKSV
jgi:hypothetical protein